MHYFITGLGRSKGANPRCPKHESPVIVVVVISTISFDSNSATPLLIVDGLPIGKVANGTCGGHSPSLATPKVLLPVANPNLSPPFFVVLSIEEVKPTEKADVKLL